MDRINELLELYFEGKTNLLQENELKVYFQGNLVKPHHEVYRSLFITFKCELEEIIPVTQKVKMPMSKSPKRVWFQISTFSGIAAALVLAFWLLGPVPTSNPDYALANMSRNEDNEYARKYTKDKLEKINEILNSGMKPIQSLDKVRNGIRPVSKLSETREKIQEIQNKLQIK